MKQDITRLAGSLADDEGGRQASLDDIELAIREGATKAWRQGEQEGEQDGEPDSGRD